MRILFINSFPFLPQLIGGVETSTSQLGCRLQQLGHEAAIMSGVTPRGIVGVRNWLRRRLTGARFPADRHRGLKVYRGYDHLAGLQEVLDDFAPDALVVSGGTDGTLELASACASCGVPTFHYFHDLASVRRLRKLPPLEGLGFFANSRYTADAVATLLGIEATPLPPLVEPDMYRISTSRAHVTMINPRQIKGGQIALDLATSCPDIPFVFLEAWTNTDPFVASVRQQASQLRNVTWKSSDTPALQVYRSTRLLLMPSLWEETWGRVATEVHLSGIPVLSTSMAALPESVGPGGVLMDRDAPPGEWRAALERMWCDADYYQSLCDRAIEYSRRDDIRPEIIAARFVDRLRAGMTRQAGASGELPDEVAHRG